MKYFNFRSKILLDHPVQLYLDVGFFLGRMEGVYGVGEGEVERAGELRRLVDDATRNYADVRVDYIVPSE